MDSGIALNHSVLVVAVAAGIAVCGVLGDGLPHNGLVLLMQFPDRSGLHGFFVPEYPESVRAVLRFTGVDVLFSLMVDREDGILPALGTALRRGGNRHIMSDPELFQVLIQPVCRKPAHLHAPTPRDGAGDQLQSQLRRGFSGILAIQLKEVAHLIQDQIIRVAFLDAVVFPHSRVRLRGLRGIFFGLDLFRLDSVILRLLLLSQIEALPDQPGDSSGDFFPSKTHLRATPFLIPYPLSAMRFVASIRIGQRVRTSARTVLLFEKIHSFPVGVGLLKKGKDASLAARYETSSRQICVDFIFGDELPDRRDFHHFRRKGPAGKVKVFKGFLYFIQPVKVKPKQIAALLLIRLKLPVLAIKPCAKRRVRQLFSKPFGPLLETAFHVFGEAGQIPGVYGFSAEILPQVPQLFGKPKTFVPFGPGQLHIGGEPSLLQKLSDTACGFLP